MKKGSSLKSFIVIITAVAILLFTYVGAVTEIKRMNRLKISKQDYLNVKLNLVEGKMVEISQAIAEGARAYLNRQYRAVAWVAIVISILLYYFFGGRTTAGFLVGAVDSALAGSFFINSS